MLKIKQMTRFRLPTFFILSAFVAGCASVQTFHMPKVEDKLAKAYETSDEVSRQIDDDWTQKKTLADSLKKGKSAAYKEIESEIKMKLTQMESAYQASQTARKSMTSAKGEVAALGYSRKKIRGDEPEYARVDDAVSQFENAAQKFNEAAANYTRESNSLADLVASKKLYYNFDVADFDKRAEKTVTTARDNLKTMEGEVTRTQNLLNSYLAKDPAAADDEATAPIVQLLEQMQTNYNEQVEKIKQMDDLRRQISGFAQGQAKIPSTAANWTDVQKAVLEFDRNAVAVNEIYKSFHDRVEKVRSMRNPNP